MNISSTSLSCNIRFQQNSAVINFTLTKGFRFFETHLNDFANRLRVKKLVANNDMGASI